MIVGINNGQAAFNRLNIGATAATARTALQLGTALIRLRVFRSEGLGTATQDFTTKEVGQLQQTFRGYYRYEGVKLDIITQLNL